MTGLVERFVRRLRQAGAVVAVDPRALAEWRRLLEQRERQREQREFDDLVRRLRGDKW